MHVQVVSLFPDMVTGAAAYGVTGRALEKNLASLGCINPRDYTDDAYQTVDDRPYGGGPGMVLKAEPWSRAIDASRAALPEGSRVIFLSPQGRVFDQRTAVELTALPGMALVCGRYEGFDERLVARTADMELSLGDYVLSGGEVAALAVIDAVLRLVPGVLGDEASAEQDSFTDGLLDCPHYTRPEHWQGEAVPEVLLSGNHAAVRRWRLKQALGRTWERRPDLLEGRPFSTEEVELLEEYKSEYKSERELSGSAGKKTQV